MNANLEHQHSDVIKNLISFKLLSGPAQAQFMRLAEVAVIPEGNLLLDTHPTDHDSRLIYLLEGELEIQSPESGSRLLAVNELNGQPFNHFKTPDVALTAKTRLTVLNIPARVLERLQYLSQFSHLPIDSAHITPVLSSPIFSQIPICNLPVLASKFRSMLVKRGDQIVTQNMPGDYLYLIKSGTAEASYRTAEIDEPVIVAEFGAGDSFGEEALQENVRRQTSVIMRESGTLLKLARKDYENLLSDDALLAVEPQDAGTFIEQGASLIDVRSEEDFAAIQVINSLSLPFERLDTELISLPTDVATPLLFISASSELSAAAVAQLAKHGRSAHYLIGGLFTLPEKYLLRRASQTSATDGETQTISNSSSQKTQEETLDKVLSSTEQTREVSDDEITSLSEQIGEVSSRLKNLKQDILDETKLAQAWLDSDQSVVGEQELKSLVEASRRIEQIESKNSPVKPDTKRDQEASRTELSQLRRQLENAQQQLLKEHKKEVNSESQSEQKELSLQRVSEELEQIKVKLKEQEKYELQRHQQFEDQLANERKKMRDQLSRFSLGLQPQVNKNVEADKVKLIVAQEMRHVIEKFKMIQAEQRVRQQQNIQKVRKQLQQQAALVIAKARKANAEKEQALAALRQAKEQIDLMRRRNVGETENGGETDVPLLVDIQSMGEKIDNAKRKLRVAESTLSVAKVENKRNRERMEKVDQNETNFKDELIEWFNKNDQFNLTHDGLSPEQQARLGRIKKLAHEALEEALSGPRNRRGPDNDTDDQAFTTYK